ncbi:hypothetical protein [Sneathiella limimaris]|uniref:hypothetical protein n=1 Tax=Sneathiella limimaris TaxID=1964213 RepID=UPI00146A2736|nr:hypothetical protein [Sneathiella limimaris]
MKMQTLNGQTYRHQIQKDVELQAHVLRSQAFRQTGSLAKSAIARLLNSIPMATGRKTMLSVGR